VATTYLEQVVYPAAVTETNEEGLLTTEAILSTTPLLTIVASASGWVEAFSGEPGETIACRLVNSAFGDCIDINGKSTTTLASGPPRPVVYQVTVPPTPTSSVAVTVPSTPTNSAVLPASPTPTSSASGSASALTLKPSSVRTGPIVGAVVGGFVVLGSVVALCVLYRQRQRGMFSIEDGITPRAFTNDVSAPGPDDTSESRHNQGIDMRENLAPRPLSVVPLRGKRTLDGNVPSSTATHRPLLRREPSSALSAGENTSAEGTPGLTISELARMLYELVHGRNDQVPEDTPPPSYLSAH